jgi:hypothetical protein
MMMAKIKSLKLKILASDSPDVVGYKLYVQPTPDEVTYQSPSFDLGNRTEVPLDEVAGLDKLDGTFNLGLAAVDDAGNESDLKVLSNIALDFFAPAAPGFEIVEE